MFVVDKVVTEDRVTRDSPLPLDRGLTEVELPDGSRARLGPAAADAYAVVQDLCLLANAEPPRFLALSSLPKTFALELLESVLTNYHALFRQHVELLALLRAHLCPLLLRLLSDRPRFPLTLRATRVVFLLLKQFSGAVRSETTPTTEQEAGALETETEVFLSLLLRIVGGEGIGESSDPQSRPIWMRVLAMEVVRGYVLVTSLN